MPNDTPKLEFNTGETKILAFDGTKPNAEGEGKYGHWQLYNVVWNGSRYTYFPSAMIQMELAQLLSHTRSIAITKSVKDGKKGPMNAWYVADAAMKTAPPVTSTQRFEAELTSVDAQTLKQDKDASIARAVCVKASAEVLPKGSTHRDVILFAELLMPYVLRGTLPKDSPVAEDIDVSDVPFG